MLRAAAVALALTLGAGAAAAQPDPTGFGPSPTEPEHMKRPEVLTGRPSGYWTSTRPANGARYRWRIMGMGGLALAVTGVLLSRKLRQINRARDGAPAPWPAQSQAATGDAGLPVARAVKS
ncbi:MAG: hypothetical protein R3B06_29450 [Kofleriaceae bacterium]